MSEADSHGLRVRGTNGEWTRLTSSRVPSVDPEIEHLWELPIGELEKILENPDHPLHEKATVVNAQAFAPISAAIEEWFARDFYQGSFTEAARKLASGGISPYAGALAKATAEASRSVEGGLTGSIAQAAMRLALNADRSWVSDEVLQYPGWHEVRESLPERQSSDPDAMEDDSPGDETRPMRAAVAPSAATSEDIAGVAEDAAEIFRADLLKLLGKQLHIQNKQLKMQSDQLKEAQEAAVTSTSALDVAKKTKTASYYAAVGGVAAALFGGVLLVMEIFK